MEEMSAGGYGVEIADPGRGKSKPRERTTESAPTDTDAECR
jgi:hypothetical protein